MEELITKEIKGKVLPHDIKMLYQLTVFYPNGEIAEQYSFNDYKGAKNNFEDMMSLGNLVALTYNVEIWKDEAHSETIYTDIIKNF